jgi:hypothetical protein
LFYRPLVLAILHSCMEIDPVPMQATTFINQS